MVWLLLVLPIVLGNVFPRFVRHDHPDSIIPNAVYPLQFNGRYSKAVKSPDFSNISFSQLRSMMAMASTSGSLTHGILGVIGISSNEQMAGINASRIITARAVMAHKQTLWNRSIAQLPRDTMGLYRLPIFCDDSVSKYRRSSPQPTTRSFAYLRPKSVNKSTLSNNRLNHIPAQRTAKSLGGSLSTERCTAMLALASCGKMPFRHVLTSSEGWGMLRTATTSKAIVAVRHCNEQLRCDRVDIAELTHIFDPSTGCLSGEFFIWWDFVDGSYRVVDWRSASKIRRPENGVQEFWDAKDKVNRRIELKVFVESWLFYDRETENRKVWPDARRRKLRDGSKQQQRGQAAADPGVP